MRVHRVAVLGAALVFAAGWFVVTAPTGMAAGAMQTAWWWQGEASNGAVPAPPTVPDGGLWVSSNATGPQAVSAIRVPLSPGETTPTLTLTVHQATPSGSGSIAVVAFPTTAAWSAGPGQAWSSKPAYNATGVGAPGQVSTDGKKVTFDLSALVAGDTLNVVIAPAPSAAPPPAPIPSSDTQAAAPTFDVSFEKPDANAFTVSPAPVADVPVPDSAASPIAAPSTDVAAPVESFTPALPAGVVAPPSAATLPQATARPSVALRTVPRRLLPVSTSRRSAADTALIAIMLGVVLLWLAREGGPLPGGRRRPRLTLYDAAPAFDAAAATRTGSPPPIR